MAAGRVPHSAVFDGNRRFLLLHHLGYEHAFVKPLQSLSFFRHNWLQLGFEAGELGKPDAVVNLQIRANSLFDLLLHDGAELVLNEEHLSGVVLHSHPPDLLPLPVVQIVQRLQRRLLPLLNPWSALREKVVTTLPFSTPPLLLLLPTFHSKSQAWRGFGVHQLAGNH